MDRFIGAFTLYPPPIVLRSSFFSWQATLSNLCFGSLVVLPVAVVYAFLVRRFSIAFLHSPRRRIRLSKTIPGTISFLTTSLAGCSIVLSPLVFGWHTSSTAVVPLSVFCLRLCCVWLGIFFGERFTPLALTGSIATGKSTVAQQLSSSSDTIRGKSFRLVDSDGVAHQILLPPSELGIVKSSAVRPADSVYHEILTTFSTRGILEASSGHIDRRKLGAIIFKDRALRRKLSTITHTKILYIMIRQVIAILYSRHSHRLIVCADVPLLFEFGKLRWMFACTIVVACDPEIQLERLMERNPDLSEEQCRQRISSQLPVAKKVEKAGLVIWNNEDRQSLSQNVEQARRECVALLHQYGNGWVSLSNSVVVVGTVLLAINFR